MSLKYLKFHIASLLTLIIPYFIYILQYDYKTLDNGYKITLSLPIVYFICLHFFLLNTIIKKQSPFIIIFTIISFIRYVILSYAILENKTYRGISGVNPSNNNLYLAGILMIYELVIVSIFIFIWAKKNIPDKKNRSKILYSQSNPTIYLLIFILSITLLFLFPESRVGLSFFGDINSAKNSSIDSLIILGIREFFVNAKYFLFFYFIIKLTNIRYQNNKSNFFKLSLLIIISFLIIALRIGTNRKIMLADTFAIILILWYLFPKYKKITTLIIGFVSLLLIIITTVYRGLSNSYLDLDFLQPYFLGQYNIAISIEARDIFGYLIDYKTYTYGFLRPIFGIGSIIKNIDYVSLSEIFNYRLSLGLSAYRYDQINPMIGEGYMLFGILLSPILTLIFARVGIFIDSIHVKSKKLEIVFISAILAFYIGQSTILNSIILLNNITFKLTIYILIYILGNILKPKNNNIDLYR